jgi:hypothetical protein
MKCIEIQELFGLYWDLPNDDLRRQAVDKHIESCPECAEEFQIWKESKELIRCAAEEEDAYIGTPQISNLVMKRIYQDESWRIPVPDRYYSISYKMRRNLTAVVAFCLALFMFSFLFSLVYEDKSDSTVAFSDSSVFGLQAPHTITASAKSGSMDGHIMTTAVASLNQQIIEPVKFHVGPIDSYSHYLLVISILGLTSTMLIMNWLSRTKA